MTPSKKGDAVGFPRVDMGQSQVEAFLDAATRERIPALLFTGPEGVGKEHTAINFARKLSCTQSPVCDLDGDLCESCRRAVALEHEDIQLIYPTPTQGSGEKEGGDEVDVGKVLDEKRQDLFETHRFTKKVSLRIARARAMIKRASTKPFGSGHNIFVVIDAHTMREEAQNALLKLVEEPPDRSVLIFVTPSPDAILYTIRSRCQRVRFAPLKPEIVESLLVDHYGIQKEAATRAAGLSRGSMLRAKNIVSDDDTADRQSALDMIQRLPVSSRADVVQQALLMSRGANRDRVARFLHEFAVTCRDVMAGDETLFINRDHARLLTEQTKKWDRERLPAVIDRVIETRDGILRRNLNIDAALVHLFLDIKNMGC